MKTRPDIEPEIRNTILEGRKSGTGCEIVRLSGGRSWVWRVYRDGLLIDSGTEPTLRDAAMYAERGLRGRR